MPQFVIIARDATDEKALERRMAARDAHMVMIDEGIATGRNIMGAAIINDEGDMCGSIMTMEFESRAALDAWMKTEPYVTGNVWADIEIIECKIPPKFLKK
jgi:uncharacterized protein YciI